MYCHIFWWLLFIDKCKETWGYLSVIIVNTRFFLSLHITQISFHESQIESMPNNLLYNHSTSGLKSSPVIKVTEVEIHDPLLMEDNNNVEKAEAYIKELEDVSDLNIFIICGIVSVMLKSFNLPGYQIYKYI